MFEPADFEFKSIRITETEILRNYLLVYDDSSGRMAGDVNGEYSVKGMSTLAGCDQWPCAAGESCEYRDYSTFCTPCTGSNIGVRRPDGGSVARAASRIRARLAHGCTVSLSDLYQVLGARSTPFRAALDGFRHVGARQGPIVFADVLCLAQSGRCEAAHGSSTPARMRDPTHARGPIWAAREVRVRKC